MGDRSLIASNYILRFLYALDYRVTNLRIRLICDYPQGSDGPLRKLKVLIIFVVRFHLSIRRRGSEFVRADA